MGTTSDESGVWSGRNVTSCTDSQTDEFSETPQTKVVLMDRNREHRRIVEGMEGLNNCIKKIMENENAS